MSEAHLEIEQVGAGEDKGEVASEEVGERVWGRERGVAESGEAGRVRTGRERRRESWVAGGEKKEGKRWSRPDSGFDVDSCRKETSCSRGRVAAGAGPAPLLAPSCSPGR